MSFSPVSFALSIFLSFLLPLDIESYPYMGNDDPIHMPRPDERTARPASRKAGLVKPSQQSAFAAQNLEDLLMYDVENEDVCGECNKRFNSKGHFT
jgi:hypothetical protein